MENCNCRDKEWGGLCRHNYHDWRKVQDLKEGDWFFLGNGKKAKVKHINDLGPELRITFSYSDGMLTLTYDRDWEVPVTSETNL
jgi:hypothetical protein